MRKKIFKIGLAVVFIGLVLVAGYRFYFVKMIRVPTGAMANTILPGDMLAAKRTLGTVKRGDIVIFKYPKDVSVQYVSRVIGLPRETIQIRDRLVYINGDEIPERRVTVKPDDYLESDSLEELSSEGSGAYRVFYVSRDNKFGSGTPASHSQAGSFGTEGPFQIPDNEYFVMGDNRDNSMDSREWGTVPRELIWGSPTIIYWSSSTRSHEETVRWDRIATRVR